MGDEYAEYVSGSGSDTLAFSYTVLATDSDTDGIYLYTNPLTYESGESIVGTDNMLAAVNEGVGKEGRPPGDSLIDGTITSMTQEADNTPATGGPGITGTPLAGETLTATTSGIEDEDGLTGAVFAYQWIRHDLGTATDTDVDGATADTYTVTAADEGKAIKVRVSFTDEARDAYKRRKPLVEPVFGIIEEQLAARRFLLRGRVNVSSEWTLLATAFNLRTPLEGVESWPLCRSTSSRPKALLRFLVLSR